MKDERRWDWGAWLTLAVGLGWLVMTLVTSLYFMQFPQDGWRYGSDDQPLGAFIAEINMTGQASVLQAGDRLVAINGQTIIPDAIPPFPPDLEERQTLTYTVNRDGKPVELIVPLVRLGPGAILYNTLEGFRSGWREPLVSLVAILVVGFAFFSRPGNLGARYLFIIFSYYFVSGWFGFFASSLYILTFSYEAQFVYGMLGLSWIWAFFASLILMPLAFPVVKAPLRRFPRLLPALVYGVALTGTLLTTRAQLTEYDGALPPLAEAFFISYLALTIISIFGTLIHNWRTVREPAVRAQLRWMTLGMGVGLGIPFLFMLVLLLQRGDLTGAGAELLWFIMVLPICLAIAITRYRLFDIDVVIRRTLVYAIVTGFLALVFYGSVLLLQQLFRSATGAQSPVAIVASTLAIAALFSPLRRLVQDFVDRRFYRRKYDAQQVLAQFAMVARDETDLERLTDELASAVQETMQPVDVRVWLRGTGR